MQLLHEKDKTREPMPELNHQWAEVIWLDSIIIYDLFSKLFTSKANKIFHSIFFSKIAVLDRVALIIILVPQIVVIYLKSTYRFKKIHLLL